MVITAKLTSKHWHAALEMIKVDMAYDMMESMEHALTLCILMDFTFI